MSTAPQFERKTKRRSLKRGSPYPLVRSRTFQERKGRRRTFKAKFARQPLPKVFYSSHVYSTSITMSPTTDGNSVTKVDFHTFRANNIYDPNYTGAGHQPRGRDDLASHYKKYVVVSSTIEARPILTGTSHYKGYSGIYLHKAITNTNHPLYTRLGAINVIDLLEGNFRCNKVLNMSNSNYGAGYYKSLTSKSGYQAVRAYGKDWEREPDYWFEESEHEAANTAPINKDTKKNYYFTVWQCNEPESGIHSVTTRWRITVRYNVKWFELKPFSSS